MFFPERIILNKTLYCYLYLFYSYWFCLFIFWNVCFKRERGCCPLIFQPIAEIIKIIMFAAMKWPTDEVIPTKDLHDFRWSSWFVGAADSPKDVIILLDVSSSMSGLNKQLARRTVSTILDTLTDNDFVNVYTFAESTLELLPCYKDMLAQVLLSKVFCSNV